MRIRELILEGTRAAQPSATSVPQGTLYFITDEHIIERSDGVNWEAYSSPPINISAGANSGAFREIVFQDGGGISWGLAGSTITATAAAAGGGITAINLSAGVAANNLTRFVLSNSNNVSFGLNGSTVTATATVATSLTAVNLSAGIAANNLSAFVLSNSNNVSFGLNGSTVTATVTVATSLSAVNLSAGVAANNLSAFVLSNSNNVSFGLNGSTVTATVTVATSLTAVNLSAGGAANNLSAFVFSNSNNVSFGLNGSTVTATATVATSLSNLRVSAGAAENLLSAITFANSNGIGFGINGSTLTASHNGLTTQTNQQMTLFATGNTTQSSTGTTNASSLIFAGSGVASVGITGGTILISVPAGGGAGTTLSTYEPYPVGGASTTIGFATNTSAGQSMFPFQVVSPVAAELVNVLVSMTFTTGGTSSFRQTGSWGWGIYSRPTGANSTRLSGFATGTFSYGVTYNNSTITIAQPTSTNSTGYGTATTSSAGLLITSGYTGFKQIGLYLGSTLTPGYYWLGMHHINSSNSFNSGLRMSLVGDSNLFAGIAPMGSLSSAFSTGTNVPLGIGGNWMMGLASYTVAGQTTLQTDVTMSQLSQNVGVIPYLRFISRV